MWSFRHWAKKEAKKERQNLIAAGWDEEKINWYIEEVYGEESLREIEASVDAEFRAKQRRLENQHACSTCKNYTVGFVGGTWCSYYKTLPTIGYADGTTCCNYEKKTSWFK